MTYSIRISFIGTPFYKDHFYRNLSYRRCISRDLFYKGCHKPLFIGIYSIGTLFYGDLFYKDLFCRDLFYMKIFHGFSKEIQRFAFSFVSTTWCTQEVLPNPSSWGRRGGHNLLRGTADSWGWRGGRLGPPCVLI